jgi:hypothetical protein
LVRGDLCIGLFALRDIAAEEELTFDYNFERCVSCSLLPGQLVYARLYSFMQV